MSCLYICWRGSTYKSNLLGLQKSTTTNGVLIELERFSLLLYAKKAAVKTWKGINKDDLLITLSSNSA